MATMLYFDEEIRNLDGRHSAHLVFGTVAGRGGDTLFFEIDGEMIALERDVAERVLTGMVEVGQRLHLLSE